MVKILRVDDGYVVSVNRRRMQITQRDYDMLKQAMEEFDRCDINCGGDLIALEINDKSFVTVTRPAQSTVAPNPKKEKS